MNRVSIVWFKHGDTNQNRPPYMSVWNYKGKFYQVFRKGEESYEALAPVLDLLTPQYFTFLSKEFIISEEELASILGDVTSCDERSKSTS